MEHITESINGIAIFDDTRYEGLIIFDEYRIIFRGEQYQCAVAFDWSTAKCSVDEETITRLGLIKRKQAHYHLYDQQGHSFDFIDTTSDYDVSTQWIRDLFKNNKKHAVERNHTAQIQAEQRQEIARLVREKEEAEAQRIAEEIRIKEVQEAETARLNEIREAKIREEMQLQELEKENKAREEELQRQAEALRISEENKFKEAQEAEKERLNEIREAKIREEIQLQKLEEQKKALEEQAEQLRQEEEQREKERQEAELRRLEEDRKIKEQQLAEMERLNAIRAEIEQVESQKAEVERIKREEKESFEQLERERKEEDERLEKEREEERKRREEARLAREREEEEQRERERQEELKRQKELRLAIEREELKKRRQEEELREKERQKKRELQAKLKDSDFGRDDKLFEQEEQLKESVYKTLESKYSGVYARVKAIQDQIGGGRYDDQESFMLHGDLAEAIRTQTKTEKMVGALYAKPYFSHIEVEFKKNEKEDYFLSDNESLDEVVDIGHSAHLLPFKQDKKRPISGALFHCYQAKKGDPISYKAPEGQMTFTPQLICDTDVENRKLKEVVQLYPTPEEFHITSDELLADKLEQNRNNPTLSNIISTLQLQQFEIIETDVNTNFVVQGCAGSGKSQCLLHRLFFLRDELSEAGWDKVLLLTPTKLFRQYSLALMKRYQLTDIMDCSITDLYIDLLNTYDKRFKERQYVFQLTEEYLPDDYLHEIYDEENVQKIEAEIDNAISNYVSQACKFLSESVPEDVDIDVINGLVERLTEKISNINKTNKSFSEDDEYQEYLKRKKEYETCVNDIKTLIKKQTKYQEELEDILDEREQYIRTLQQVAQYKEKRTKNAIEKITEIQNAFSKYEKAKESASNRTDELLDLDNLKQIIREAGQDPEREKIDDDIDTLDRYDKRRAKLEDTIGKSVEAIAEKTKTIEEFLKWVKDVPFDTEGSWSKKASTKASITQVRYYLSRIESAIFEQEVWNVMAPIKQRYDIQTLDIEVIGEDKRKENRILYKSDLLFYIMIYMKLYPKTKLPEYSLIAIDEAQDLHRADYETLHSLYPKATFNLFGDVDQVLHTAAGISDWREQTDIHTIYPLMTNYRNTAAIVDFCNRQFDVNMDYVGDPEDSFEPIVVSDPELAKDILEDEDAVIIVKDRDVYIELCDEMGVIPEDYAFLDTTSEKPMEGDKECYSIFAAKGLEFTNVFVFGNNMTKNQRVVACTRAMNKLFYYGGESV